MNILTICPRLPYPVTDGGAQGSFNIIRTTAKNHSLTVLSFESDIHKQDVSGIEEYATVFTEKVEFKPYSLSSILLSFLKNKPITISHRMDVSIFRNLLENVKDQDFDIVSFHGIHPTICTDLVKKYFPKAKLVTHSFNTEYLLLKRRCKNEKNILKKLFLAHQSNLMRSFELKQLNKMDLVTCVSTYDKTLLNVELPSLKTETLFPIYAKPFPIINKQYDKNKIVAISSWKWEPNSHGLEWFITEVWDVLKSKQDDIELHIAGNGLDNSILDIINTKSGITYHGFVDDLEDFIKDANFQIVPLFFGSGVKIKVIEALAIGLPIVTTSIGAEGIPLEVDKDFLLAETPEEFKTQCLKYIQNESIRNQIANFGQETAKKHFTFEGKVEKIDRILNSILFK